jgi:hypothetical protein
MKEKNNSSYAIGGFVFVGCMFIGAGIGMIYDSKEIGSAIGMGIGFIGMGAIWAYYRNKQ